jgi:sporulation protein YqfC
MIDWPRFVLSGNRSISIQNHRGVIEYDCSIVRIQTKFGEVKVTGSGLTLLTALKEEIVIEGKIESLSLLDWR